MGNIKNYNFKYQKTRLSNDEYWDYCLSNDNRYTPQHNGILSGESLVINIDFNNPNIYSSGATSGFTITSLDSWGNAINNGIQLNDIGLTGLDNGLIRYEKLSGDTGNTELTTALLTSTLEIPSENKSFFMTKVTGLTEDYIYPIINENDSQVGGYAQFCGGFYQGFYKLDGFDYEVLPNRVNKGWVADFWVKKGGCTSGGTSGTTILNDTHPDNEGFFFYMGTRSENKFWTVFDGLNTGCTVNCTPCILSGITEVPTEYCTIPKETNVTSSTGSPLSPPPIEIKEITNNFLIYHRGKGKCCGESCHIDTCNGHWEIDYTGGTSGLTADIPYSLYRRNLESEYCKFDYHDSKFSECRVGKKAACYDGEPIYFSSITETLTDDRNPFLIYSRSKGHQCGISGTTGRVGVIACEYSGNTTPLLELDYEADLIYNVFGFRVKNDGSVGYRLIDVTCLTGVTGNSPTIKTTGLTIEENYSVSGVVKDNEWVNISIRFVADKTYTDCELGFKPQRTGKLMFYVNSKLKLTVHGFKEIILKRLLENNSKQEGVPFNYSLGGGTQGLIESMTFDGKDPDDIGLIVEKNFTGTFIGGISKFRFYINDLGWCGIRRNYIETLNSFN